MKKYTTKEEAFKAISIHSKINSKKFFDPIGMFGNAKDVKAWYLNHFCGIV